MKLFGGDKPRKGKHYEDRLHRILGVCHSMGILWREQRSEYHGQVETYRQELVRPVGEVVLTATLEKYGLTVTPAVLARIKGMAPQFCYALNVASVRVEVEGDTVYVCVPRDLPQGEGVVLFAEAWAMGPDLGGALLCGVTDAGEQAVLDLADPAHAHCVAIGMTGSGKTTLLQTMLLSAEMEGLRVAILDPLGKRGGLWPLSGHPSVWRGGMFADPREIEQALAILAGGDHSRELRFVDVDGAETAQRDNSDVFVFVDEVPMLARRPGIADRLTELAQVGRHGGVHLVLGSQSATGIPALANTAARLVGRVADRQASYFATGREGAGAELLRGKGDMLFACGDTLAHFQGAMPGPEMLKQWARRYPPQWGRLPAMATTERKKSAEGAASPTFIRAQSVASLGAVVTADPGPSGEIGRPMEEPSRRVVCWVASEWQAKGRPPSLTRIYETTRRWYAKTGGYGRDKARRTIELARALGVNDGKAHSAH